MVTEDIIIANVHDTSQDRIYNVISLYTIETKKTFYYMPLSRFHLNVFAERLLTMPPTKLTVNLFNIESDMRYDLSVVKEVGETPYENLKNTISLVYCIQRIVILVVLNM